MQRTLYAHKIEVKPISEKIELCLESFESDFIAVMEDLCAKSEIERKYDFRQEKKILYLDRYEYNDETRTVNMKFISAKYDARRRVIDTDTFTDKGILKNIGDGDAEKNHLCIKFVEDDMAVCLFETNYYGIGFGKILYYLETKIREYHRTRSDKCYYKLKNEYIVSKDFLASLEKMTKVKVVTLTVDQEDVKVSDYKALSGRADISSNVDIIMKPAATGLGIKKDTVKDFFRLYSSADRNVKRVTVQGDGEESQTLSFDTEQMKHKIVVNVEATDETGEVNTRSIFDTLFVEVLSL